MSEEKVMAVSVILAAVDTGADAPSLAATAPDAFLLGARTAVEHWGGALEWRSDGSLCARITGEELRSLAHRAARCALSLRALVPGAMALAIDHDEHLALARATVQLRRGPEGVNLDAEACLLLVDGAFEIEQQKLRAALPADNERALSEGDVVGRYTIEEILGHGGMGMVYRARDPRLGRAVALKLLAPGRGGGDAAARLIREARAAASFAHPNVVAVHDVGEAEGVPWVAMELIEGRSLRDAIGDDSVPLGERLRWLLDVANALAEGHRAGLVHRDIKPDNVMIRRDGVVKVLDYGIARRLSDEGAIGELATLTGEGTILGTPLYMAPEQMRGDAIDARVDQFAWGVTAYELLTGKRPWGVAGDMKALARMLTTEPEPIAVPELPDEVARAIQRTLARDATARFPSMDDVIAVLARYVESRSASLRPVGRRADTPSEAARAPRPRWLLPGLGALAVGAAIAFGARRARQPAETAPAPSASVALIAGLAEAQQSWADGSTLPARRAVEAVVARDPAAAPAWLRLAMWTEDIAASRAAFQHAQRLRERLDERDRALLDALEPRHRAPPDAAEWDARLSKLVERWPSDGEVRLWLARAKRMRGAYDVAAALLERTVTENPALAGAALAQLGELHRSQHKPKEALAAYDRCLARASSIDCFAGRARVRASVGDCAGMESDARQWANLDPSDPAAEEAIATVLYARRAPMVAVREALRAKTEKSLPAERATIASADDYRVAMAEGDFVRARAVAEARAAALPSGAGFFPHFQAAVDVMLAMNEGGDILASGKFAHDFVKRARAWTPESVAQAAYPILMLGRAYTGGAINHAEFSAERSEMLAVAEAAWERAGKPRDSYQRSVLWIGAHGLASFTEVDVQEALADLPRYEPLPSPGAISPEIDGMIGAFYRAARRPDEAMSYLRIVTDSCNAFALPYGYIWAHVELGLALEQKKMFDEAAAAYRVVLERTAGAKPRSVAADAARARLKALGR